MIRQRYAITKYSQDNIYLILLSSQFRQMLPTMRYKPAKLSERVHQQKSYRLHVNSVDKIMRKTSNQFLKRYQQLRQLKDRKEQSHSYNHYKKSKEIGHVNNLLYGKIYSSSKIDKKYGQGSLSNNQSLEMLQEKIKERNQEEEDKNQKGSIQHSFVLRNHRQYPIHKSTLLQRTRENIRLAQKIVNPVVTYRTQNFMKKHEESKNHKERIMRYEPQFAKTKVDMYVEKKLSISMLSRKKSDSSLSRSSYEKFNPEMSPRNTKNRNLGFQLQQKIEK